MTTPPDGDIFGQLKAAWQEVRTTLDQIGPRFTAQEALGWILTGDPEAAVKAVRRLPDDQLEPLLDALDLMAGMIRIAGSERGMDLQTFSKVPKTL